MCISGFPACARVYIDVCVYMRLHMHIQYVFVYVCGCAHMCSAVRGGYKSGAGDHAAVSNAATSGAPSLQVGAFR